MSDSSYASDLDAAPTIHNVKRHAGIAGQFVVTADVTYPDEPLRSVAFTGSVYGGPVVMTTEGNPGGTFVSDPSRFGEFGVEWVRRFFASA